MHFVSGTMRSSDPSIGPSNCMWWRAGRLRTKWRRSYRRVCLATGHDPNYKDLAAITLPTIQAYAKRHKYFLSYDGEGDDKDACKVRLFNEAMRSGEFSA